MKNTTVEQFIRLILLMLVGPMLTACATSHDGHFSGPEVRGTVSELVSEKLVAGAVVVWNWKGLQSLGGIDAQQVCYRIAITTTDENGKFFFPAWEFTSKNVPPIGALNDSAWATYKFGYRKFIRGYANSTKNERNDITLDLIREEEQYLNEIISTSRALNCTYSDNTLDEKEIEKVIILIKQLIADFNKLTYDAEADRFLKILEKKLDVFKNLYQEKYKANLIK